MKVVRHSYKPKDLEKINELLEKKGYSTHYYPKSPYSTDKPLLNVRSTNFQVRFEKDEVDIFPHPRDIKELTSDDEQLLKYIKEEYKHTYNPKKLIWIPIAGWVVYLIYKHLKQ